MQTVIFIIQAAVLFIICVPKYPISRAVMWLLTTHVTIPDMSGFWGPAKSSSSPSRGAGGKRSLIRISEIAKKRSATQSWSQTYTSLLEWSSQLADISWWEHNLPNDSLSATHRDDKNFLSISASFSFGLFTSIDSNYTLSLLWIPDWGLKTRAQSCRNFQEV